MSSADVAVVFILFDLGVLILAFVLFITQLGYLHITRALCICCCSSSICCWLEHVCFALCKRVLMILYLFAMAWRLSHCKYWLVWVGFLYTVVARLPSLCSVTKVSKKGIDPPSTCGLHQPLKISNYNICHKGITAITSLASNICH